MPLIDQVLEQYPKEVEVVVKNFPLNMHKMAGPAAVAAMAANRQGKFWEYQAKLFENQKQLSEEKFKEIATGLNLDMPKFEADLKDPSVQAEVSRDMQQGQKAEVRGTPAIFVNGRLLKNRTFPAIRELIDKQLERSKSVPK